MLSIILFQPKWPIGAGAYISGFCSVSVNPSQVRPQQMLVLILPTPQGWKAESTLAEKKVTQMFNTRHRRDLNPGP